VRFDQPVRSSSEQECFSENYRDFCCLNSKKVLSLLYTRLDHPTGPDVMIRYSSYSCTNYREKPIEKTDWLDPLEKAYGELLELRERVKQAEAAAAKGIMTPTKGRGVPAPQAHLTKGFPPRAALAYGGAASAIPCVSQ
jgi:hypothetical protein